MLVLYLVLLYCLILKFITMATIFSICVLLFMVGLGITNMCLPSTTDRDAEKYLQ